MITKYLLLLLIGLSFMQVAPPRRTDNQILTTKLQVTVRDELGNLVSGANVRLFKTEDEYNKEVNQVAKTLTTDDKGRASFDDIEPVVYYIIVEKGDLNNNDSGNKTETLVAKRVNKITIIIS